MKRDMDLVRKILFCIEDFSTADEWLPVEIPEYNNSVISYHLKLLNEAGLIEAINLSDSDGIDWRAGSLTWKGHEFLEAARNNSRWQSAKKLIIEKGGSLTFEILKLVLTENLKSTVLHNL